MFGLGAAKGVTLEKDEPQPGQSLLKKDSVSKIPDLSKLQVRLFISTPRID